MRRHISDEDLSAWVDRELPSAEFSRVEQHLKSCDRCRMLERELALMTQAFRSAERLSLPPAVWPRIESALQASFPGEQVKRRFDWLRWPQFAISARNLAFAMVILALLGGLVTVFEYRMLRQNEIAAIVEIDRAHTELVAYSPTEYNPFRFSIGKSFESNPFAQKGLMDNANPFRPLLGNR